jgi:hypothetical protein
MNCSSSPAQPVTTLSSDLFDSAWAKFKGAHGKMNISTWKTTYGMSGDVLYKYVVFYNYIKSYYIYYYVFDIILYYIIILN